MKRLKPIFLAMFLLLITDSISAQEEESNDKFKISGYIQMDFQSFFVPDSIGATTPFFATFSGGNFVNRYTTDRFALRRGRLKFTNEGTNHKGVFSFDVSERGVGIRDLYIKYTEPWMNSFSLYGGMFNRPFGLEIDYSSSERETPERSRIIQTIFPHERDLGIMAEFQMPEESSLPWLNLRAAVVNGNSTAIETDNYKDLLGRLGAHFENEETNFSFKAGISFYNGKVKHIYEPVDTIASNTTTKFYIYNFEDIVDSTGRTTKGFVLDSLGSVATGTMGGAVDRKYMGFDIEMSFNSPFGKTTLRGEYISGTQPSAINYKDVEQAYIIYNGMNSFSPTGPFLGVSWPMYDQPQPYNPVSIKPTEKNHHTFIRKFSGGYFYLIQNIFNSDHQIVFKYDWYDPNTEIAGANITYDDDLYLNDPTYIKPYVSPADIKFETMGIGLNLQMNEKTKLMIYYEHPKNEITDLKAYEGDIRLGRNPSPGYDRDIKDDVVTVRLQYKF